MIAEGRLRIATLNIWSLNEWEARRGAIVTWINRLKPDAIGLQRVSRTGSACQATWLGERTGMNVAFGGLHRPDGTLFGNAILSRMPIVDSEHRVLPNSLSKERRLCLRAALDTPRGPIQLYNTHLNYLFDEGYVREAQVVALSEFIAETYLQSCPAVLTGDFNAVPGSTEIRYLKGQASLDGGSFHLFDSYEAARPASLGFTWDNQNPYAAKNRVPDQRIDYIFVGVRTEDGTGQILDSNVAFDEPIAGTWPSDHYGVFTDIAFHLLGSADA